MLRDFRHVDDGEKDNSHPVHAKHALHRTFRRLPLEDALLQVFIKHQL